MYTKLLCCSIFFTTFTSYTMVPGRVLASRLTTAIISAAQKQRSIITTNSTHHAEDTLYETAAKLQAELKTQKTIVHSEIPLSSAAEHEKKMAVTAIEDKQKQISGGIWSLDLLRNKPCHKNRTATKRSRPSLTNRKQVGTLSS